MWLNENVYVKLLIKFECTEQAVQTFEVAIEGYP